MNTIYEHMSSPVVSVKSDSNAIDGIAKMYKNNISALLVENDGRYVGIFTKADWIDMIRNKVSIPVGCCARVERKRIFGVTDPIAVTVTPIIGVQVEEVVYISNAIIIIIVV